MVVTLASAALVIPYLLFSPLAGRLAKIYKKRKDCGLGEVCRDADHGRGRGRVPDALDGTGVVVHFVDGVAERTVFLLRSTG